MRASARHLPLLALIVPTAVLIALRSPLTLLVWLTDGLYALAVILAATGWGAWPARWLGPAGRPAGQQVCIAAALGLGVLATLVLALGCVGWLNQAVSWALIAAGGVLGLSSVARRPGSRLWTAHIALGDRPPAGLFGKAASNRAPGSNPNSHSAGRHLLLAAALALTLCVPLVVLLLASSLPPGVVWAGEAGGYDVLEYHLQAPREYFDAGRIHFLPHNVYASFPQQMEMLYLLLMHMAGDAHAAAIPSQMLHALCAMLAVFALACWSGTAMALLAWRPQGVGGTGVSPVPSYPLPYGHSSDQDRRGLVVTPWVVAVVAGTTPWVAYTGCLAYVECGMLLFAAVAAGLLGEGLYGGNGYGPDASTTHGQHARTSRLRADGTPALPGETGVRTLVIAGLCAGLAGACKYTGLALVAVALVAAFMVAVGGGWRRRAWAGGVLAVSALAAFSPWLVRNTAFTGNPVYPFAYATFGGAAWSAEQDAQWARGHRMPQQDDSVAGRARVALRELVGQVGGGRGAALPLPSLFGFAVVPLGLLGLLLGRGRLVAMAGLWAGLIVLAWAGATHMPGRFAMPLIVPLAMLTGAAVWRTPADWRWLLAAGVVAGGVVNAVVLASLLRGEDLRWRKRADIPLPALVGQTELFLASQAYNAALPEDAYVWLVGDAAVYYVQRRMHYTVVFNRDPWIALAESGASAGECLDWLRQRGVTHVAFSWAEIERLRATYGFSPHVRREWVGELQVAGLAPVDWEWPPGVEVYAVDE